MSDREETRTTPQLNGEEEVAYLRIISAVDTP
jgi:hypothetical protein